MDISMAKLVHHNDKEYQFKNWMSPSCSWWVFLMMFFSICILQTKGVPVHQVITDQECMFPAACSRSTYYWKHGEDCRLRCDNRNGTHQCLETIPFGPEDTALTVHLGLESLDSDLKSIWDVNTSSTTLHLQINDHRPSSEECLEHESYPIDFQHAPWPYGMYIAYASSAKPFIFSISFQTFSVFISFLFVSERFGFVLCSS